MVDAERMEPVPAAVQAMERGLPMSRDPDPDDPDVLEAVNALSVREMGCAIVKGQAPMVPAPR